jgi:hypothetical protein
LIKAWFAAKRTYLQQKEVIDTVQGARLQLGLLEAYQKEKADMTAGDVAALKTLGAEIRAAEYKTTYSQWVYEQPTEVSALETEVEASMWTELDTLRSAKQAVLDDDLAREQYKEATRLKVKNHTEMYNAIDTWSQAKLAYLNTKEAISNSEQAKTQLSLLDTFETEKEGMHVTSVASLIAVGDEIRAAEYKTTLSQWKYEHPAQVAALETQVCRVSAQHLILIWTV